MLCFSYHVMSFVYSLSINYIHKGKIWDQNTTFIDDAFSFQVAMDIISNNEDQELIGRKRDV